MDDTEIEELQRLRSHSSLLIACTANATTCTTSTNGNYHASSEMMQQMK